jgi:NADH-quinone oxidoreductase subunit N
MKALTYTSFLGIACMILEIANLRRVVIPFVLAALAIIFCINYTDWTIHASHYHDMLHTDQFAVAFTGLFIVTVGMLVAMTKPFYQTDESHLADYIAIIIFTLCGAIAMVSFSNMAIFFIGLETLSISQYILAGSRKRDIRSNEAAMKYFLMGSFASGILLYGIALIYGATGSFNIDAIGAYASGGHVDTIFIIGVVMVLIAMLFKVSAAPFHFWAPDVYEGSPTLTTAMMATLAKVAAMAAFYRLFSMAFIPSYPYLTWVLSAVAALTMVIGNFTALQQDSFKRMLAFSGIAHAGYMLLTILTIDHNNPSSLYFYAVAYTLASLGAFAIAIYVASYAGTERIEGFNGLGKSNPLMAVSLTALLISMAGIPPMAGFFAKYYVFLDAIASGHTALVIVAVITSAISVYYYFKVILAMWTQPPTDGHTHQGSYIYSVIAVVSVLLTLLLGMFPGVLAGMLG